jgi:hypothetical protein
VVKRKRERSLCRIPGCGRPSRALGVCQTHYKHLRKFGRARPIKPRRGGRANTVKFAGFSVTAPCADVIRSEAALSFIDLWLAVRRPGERHPDPFNGWRRIESVSPAVTARLERLLAEDAEAAARGILELAEAEIAAGWTGWPSRGAEAVRRRLGW